MRGWKYHKIVRKIVKNAFGGKSAVDLLARISRFVGLPTKRESLSLDYAWNTVLIVYSRGGWGWDARSEIKYSESRRNGIAAREGVRNLSDKVESGQTDSLHIPQYKIKKIKIKYIHIINSNQLVFIYGIFCFLYIGRNYVCI